jgi:hypothetical protein
MDPAPALHPPIVAYATPEPWNKDSRTNLGASASQPPPPPIIEAVAPRYTGAGTENRPTRECRPRLLANSQPVTSYPPPWPPS